MFFCHFMYAVGRRISDAVYEFMRRKLIILAEFSTILVEKRVLFRATGL